MKNAVFVSAFALLFFMLSVNLFGADSIVISPDRITFPDDSFQTIAGGDNGSGQWTNTVIVSPKATAAESGTALKEALSSITDASYDNPYLIKIEPGVYDLGISALSMKPNVDIEGSGKGITMIKGRVGNNLFSFGLIQGAPSSELRYVTVQNNLGDNVTDNNYAIYNNKCSLSIKDATIIATGGDNTYAVFNTSVSEPTLTNVEIVSVNANKNTYGVCNISLVHPTLNNVQIIVYGGTKNFGIYSYADCQVTAINVEVRSSDNSWGIYNEDGSTLTLRESHIKADAYGVVNQKDNTGTGGGGAGGTITIDRSTIIGGANQQSLRVEPGAGAVFVGCSLLDGPVSGIATCVGAYDGAYNPLDASCQLPIPE